MMQKVRVSNGKRKMGRTLRKVIVTIRSTVMVVKYFSSCWWCNGDTSGKNKSDEEAIKKQRKASQVNRYLCSRVLKHRQARISPSAPTFELDSLLGYSVGYQRPDMI